MAARTVAGGDVERGLGAQDEVGRAEYFGGCHAAAQLVPALRHYVAERHRVTLAARSEEVCQMGSHVVSGLGRAGAAARALTVSR